jgi:hypothetical protein
MSQCLSQTCARSGRCGADGLEEVDRPVIDDPNDDPADVNDGFGVEGINIDERDNDRLAIKLSDYDLARLVDDLEEFDKTAKIDVNKLARNADPLAERIDMPGPIERQEAIKILRMLMLGMRSLWHPVKRAISDHATMKSLGKTQNVSDGVAATVGRTRVIEGLRIAEPIRKGLGKIRQDNDCEARHWPASARQGQRRYMAFFDRLISDVLAGLAETPVPANDNCGVEAVAAKAA